MVLSRLSGSGLLVDNCIIFVSDHDHIVNNTVRLLLFVGSSCFLATLRGKARLGSATGAFIRGDRLVALLMILEASVAILILLVKVDLGRDGCGLNLKRARVVVHYGVVADCRGLLD